MTTPGSDAALPDEAARDLDRFAPVDLPCRHPCFDNADTIGGVVTAVEAGLRRHVPKLRALICASDGGSTDGTIQAVPAGGDGDDAEQLPIPPDTRPIAKTAFMSYLVSARATDDPAPVVNTMVPLYYARTATFVRDTLDVTDQEAEALVEEGVDVAETEKPYLRERWTAATVPAP